MRSHRVEGTARRRRSRATALALGIACLLPLGCRKIPDIRDRVLHDGEEHDAPLAKDPVPSDDVRISVGDGEAWLQMKSGEWLRGELIRIRDDEVLFDSKEFDEQTLDLEDVQRIYSPLDELVVVEDGSVYGGKLYLVGDDIWIDGDRTLQIERKDLVSVLSVSEGRDKRWFVDVSVGATVRSGNTEQLDLSAAGTFLRETASSRTSFSYYGVVSTVGDAEVANNHRINAAQDAYVTRRLYLTVIGAELFTDQFQNIDLRSTVFAAVGYKIVNTPDQTWRLSVGPGYQATNSDSGAFVESSTNDSGAIILKSDFDWEITGDIDLTFDYSLTAPVPDVDQYNHNFVSKLSFDLTDDLDLDLSFNWDRVNDPVRGSDGVLPEPDDFRTFVGLTWKF